MKKRMKVLQRIALLSLSIFVMISCSSSSDGDDMPTDNFDRTAFLTNMADNIILPALEDFQSDMSALDVARANFVNDKTQTNLDALSTAWLTAYTSWQNVEVFNIGSALSQSADVSGFVVVFNRYPVTVSLIENAAATGNYDLLDTNFYNGQGFPALDFLIHGTASGDATALDKFTTNANSDGYTTYMTDVFSRMNASINAVTSDWQGTFRNTFVSNTSSSASGSISVFTNEYIRYYERELRAKKVGIPAGNFSATPKPQTVEALYKQDVSKQLLLTAFNNFENIFNGQSSINSSTAEGFADYLDEVGRTDLKNEINNQFDVIREKIQDLDDNFVNQINTDNTKMTEAYDALQRAVVLLKVDMASALNIAIIFQDNDGD